MLEGLKRYYANSFADADKQTSIDLFLGQHDTERHGLLVPVKRRTTPHVFGESCLKRDLNDSLRAERLKYLVAFANTDTHFWEGYYRPSLFTEYVCRRLHSHTSVCSGTMLTK